MQSVVINQMQKMNAKLVSGPFNHEFLIGTDGGQGDSSLCQTVTQLKVMLAPARLSMRASLTVRRRCTSCSALLTRSMSSRFWLSMARMWPVAEYNCKQT